MKILPTQILCLLSLSLLSHASPNPHPCEVEVQKYIASNIVSHHSSNITSSACRDTSKALRNMPSFICSTHSKSNLNLATSSVLTQACASSCNETLYTVMNGLLTEDPSLGKCNAVVEAVHHAVSIAGCPSWLSDPQDANYTNVGFQPYQKFYEKECWKGCNETVLQVLGKFINDDKTGHSIGCSMVGKAIRHAALDLKACPRNPRDPTDRFHTLLTNSAFGYQQIYLFQHCPAACGYQIGRTFKIQTGEGSEPCMYKCQNSTKYKTGAARAMARTISLLENDERCKDVVDTQFILSNTRANTKFYNTYHSVANSSDVVLSACRKAIRKGVLEISKGNHGPADAQKTPCEQAVIAHRTAMDQGICPDVMIEPWNRNIKGIKGHIWRSYMHDYYVEFCGKFDSEIVNRMKADRGTAHDHCSLAKNSIEALVLQKYIKRPDGMTKDFYLSDQYGYASLTRFYCMKTYTDELRQHVHEQTERGSKLYKAIEDGIRTVVDSADDFDNPNRISSSTAMKNFTHPPFYGQMAERVQHQYCTFSLNQTFNYFKRQNPSADHCSLLKESINNNVQNCYDPRHVSPTTPSNGAHHSSHLSYPGICIMSLNGCISKQHTPLNCTASANAFAASLNLHHRIKNGTQEAATGTGGKIKEDCVIGVVSIAVGVDVEILIVTGVLAKIYKGVESLIAITYNRIFGTEEIDDLNPLADGSSPYEYMRPASLRFVSESSVESRPTISYEEVVSEQNYDVLEEYVDAELDVIL